MIGDVNVYLGLVTSEHNQRPKYMEFLKQLMQAFADQINVLDSMILLFDVDTAVGTQLDATGSWVGTTRYIAGLPTPLDDDTFRRLIKAKIQANYWDGTMGQIVSIWNSVFADSGYTTMVQDNCDMSMIVAFYGPVYTGAIFKQIIDGGYLDLHPAGVEINYLGTPTPGNVPFFGFDIENTYIAGFDVGYFGAVIT